VLINWIAICFDLANKHPFWLIWLAMSGSFILMVLSMVGTWFHWRVDFKEFAHRLINKL